MESSAPASFDTEITDRLLTTTRAVRKRLDLTRPVDLGVVRDCLRLAIQAPTGGNTQGWRWMVVDDPDLRAGLADLYRRSFEPYIAGSRAAYTARTGEDDHAVFRSSEYLAAHLQDVPVHVIPCLLGRLPDGATTVESAGFYGSIIPAAWSFMLALRSRGLGSAWTTLHLRYEQEAGKLLGIPDTVTQVALIPVAHTIGDQFRPATRRPVEEISYRNRWREPLAGDN
jgi:nitroreductase